MAIFYINVFIIAHDKLCKIDRAPYDVQLISYNAGRASADVFYIQTPAGARTICDHAR